MRYFYAAKLLPCTVPRPFNFGRRLSLSRPDLFFSSKGKPILLTRHLVWLFHFDSSLRACPPETLLCFFHSRYLRILLLNFRRYAVLASEDLDYGVLTHFQGKRLFIKDIIHYLVPPNRAPPSIAPSLLRKERGVGTPKTRTNGVSDSTADVPYPYQTDVESGNPTVIPNRILDQFHFTFLIRHPRYSIPSYYRCTVPPLDKITGFYDFMPSEAGYDELRRVFDYLRSVDQIGPHVATQEIAYTEENGNSFANGRSGAVDICVVDADDLLDHPAKVIKTYCDSVGIAYDQTMLNWNSEEDRHQARDAFKKWPGFHEDAVNSCDLKPRMHVSIVC